MYAFGFAIVALGLLAELPQGLASMGTYGVIHSGSLPGNGLTRDLAWFGFVLVVLGLSRMLRIKGYPGWAGLIGLLGFPGALVGLLTVSLLRRKTNVPSL